MVRIGTGYEFVLTLHRVILPLLLTPLLWAQVEITGNNTIHFESLVPNRATGPAMAPSREISWSTYSFVVANDESLDNYRAPSQQHPDFGSKLHGRRPLGRLLLVNTCSANCESKTPTLGHTVFVNVAADRADTEWVQAAYIDGFGLTVLRDIFRNPNLDFAINGALIHANGDDMHFGNPSLSHYYMQAFERSDKSCRRYKAVYGPDANLPGNESDAISIDLPWIRRQPEVANGIVVGAPKVYDTYALRSMYSETLQKISTINPFVASQLTGSYGTLQGVTRDQSYSNVQGGIGYPAPTATVTGVSDQLSYCPPGYYPAGPSACAPLTTGNTSTTVPPATTVTQNINPPTLLTPTIPPQPTASPLSAPTNVGQSSADALVEQVQLSGQLQMYQLLLQGAQSDTLFVQNARAIATRAQTTVGFPISIDPPRQFRHAVAEVRVLIEPYPTPESGETPPVSIVNLLPSQKTYNVAKITSKQHAFGGGAVIEQVASVGVTGGKSKDRLYLAKDTDTVALQYDHPSVKPLHLPLPERALTGLEGAVRMQRLDDCDNEWFAVDGSFRGNVDSDKSRSNSVLFGWQFRPVLGADYVVAGPRQVFAQLALPEGLDEASFQPAVLVQTRWREYDEKRQVVGPVFHSSCTVTTIKDPVIIQNKLQVQDAAWEDIGNGLLKIKAHGSFFSPGILMQSGKNTYPAVAFDGQELQFFAPAKDLFNNGEVSLIGQNSRATNLAIPLGLDKNGCKVESAWVWAIPQADGNARVRLMLQPAEKFRAELPRTQPLVLIGSDVYGLKDKPFQNGKSCDNSADFICTFHFTADLDALRAAGNYYVRDLVWSGSNMQGGIRFAPFMAALSKYSEDPPAATPVTVKATRKAVVTKPVVADDKTTYMVRGSDLKVFLTEDELVLKAFSMDAPNGMKPGLTVISDSEALLTLPHAPKGKSLTVAWTPKKWPLSQEGPIVWDLTIPGQPARASIAAMPSFINTGDSRTVTYTGCDFSSVTAVTFEKVPLTFKVTPGNPNSMDVVIPSTVSKDPGHKELVASTKDKKGKAGQMVLPLDVFKQ